MDASLSVRPKWTKGKCRTKCGGGKCRTKNATAETWTPASGGWLRYVIIRQLRLHNVRGRGIVREHELCGNIHYDCERNVPYAFEVTRSISLLVVPKVLCKRSHGYKLPEHTSSLNDSNFLTRMLYKTLTDLMTFVDICLYFILIVLLRFVNHLLNYYLLTYLLTYLTTANPASVFYGRHVHLEMRTTTKGVFSVTVTQFERLGTCCATDTWLTAWSHNRMNARIHISRQVDLHCLPPHSSVLPSHHGVTFWPAAYCGAVYQLSLAHYVPSRFNPITLMVPSH